MRCTALFCLASLVPCCVSIASHVRHEVHEERQHTGHWEKIARPRFDKTIPVRISLTQQNLDQGERWLHEISDPTSTKYGQLWSHKDIIETFSASAETTEAVSKWLDDVGISRSRHGRSISKNWLHFNATVAEAELLFNTQFHVFRHRRSGKTRLACDAYSLPAHLQPHVDFISPGIHLDSPIKHDLKLRPFGERNMYTASVAVTPIADSLPLPRSMPAKPEPMKTAVVIDDVQSSLVNGAANCGSYMTPGCLQFLYQIPVNFQANSGNTFGISEYDFNSWNQTDLALYFSRFSARALGTAPTLAGVDGGYDYLTNMSLDAFGYEAETMLDLTLGYTAWPQPVTVFEVGASWQASFDNFLDAIDPSFCTFDGGDVPFWDGSYGADEMCGTYTPPNVISTSWGYPEYALPISYATRQCYEYMKLGLAGVTIVYSSGDNGVAGSGGYCQEINSTARAYNSGRFVTEFPASCPWVLSVGSTQVPAGTNIVANAQAGIAQSEVSTSSFASGGGFSDRFTLPSYQTSAVGAWWNNANISYNAAQFNMSQMSRGVPDVSANGWNAIVPLNGTFYLFGGTSASAPIVASMLTMVNQNRLNAGKSTVGFVNPAFYANPQIFNDITSGSNPGCGTNGFSASQGWDPVSGLGTPNYPAMLAMFLSLP